MDQIFAASQPPEGVTRVMVFDVPTNDIIRHLFGNAASVRFGVQPALPQSDAQPTAEGASDKSKPIPVPVR